MYITETETSKKALQIELCTFLASAPNLDLICNEEWRRWGSRQIDVLIQDMFEVKNPGFDEHPYLLLPTGCPSLIFVLNQQNSSCFLCGPLTTARRISVPAKGSIFCIQLVPGCMKWFVTGPVFYFANQVMPLNKYVVRTDDLLLLLRASDAYEQRCTMALNFLDNNIQKRFYVEPMIQEVIQHINKCKGRFHVYDVEKVADHSERYVSRVFKDTVGVTIKTYCEIVKFQHSLNSIVMMHPQHISSVAHAYGYFDLPHMNRAYKKFLGYTANEIKHLEMEAIYVLDLLCDG